MNKKLTFILASSSPRRKKILDERGYNFEIILPKVDEVTLESARETVLENARRKAVEASKNNPDALVIGSDTVVSLEDKVLGKPKDLDEAIQMLQSLSGKTHEVLSGVCLSIEEQLLCFYDTSNVTFKALNSESISHYFDLCNPLDKAGSYNIDEHGELIIEKIEGSYANIMGLPIEKLEENLKKIKI